MWAIQILKYIIFYKNGIFCQNISISVENSQFSSTIRIQKQCFLVEIVILTQKMALLCLNISIAAKKVNVSSKYHFYP